MKLNTEERQSTVTRKNSMLASRELPELLSVVENVRHSMFDVQCSMFSVRCSFFFP